MVFSYASVDNITFVLYLRWRWTNRVDSYVVFVVVLELKKLSCYRSSRWVVADKKKRSPIIDGIYNRVWKEPLWPPAAQESLILAIWSQPPPIIDEFILYRNVLLIPVFSTDWLAEFTIQSSIFLKSSALPRSEISVRCFKFFECAALWQGTNSSLLAWGEIR